MVGTQDASKFNMEEGEFFLIKKIDFLIKKIDFLIKKIDFLFNQV